MRVSDVAPWNSAQLSVGDFAVIIKSMMSLEFKSNIEKISCMSLSGFLSYLNQQIINHNPWLAPVVLGPS